MTLKQHTEYKESGLPLTPMVPSHWQRTALKHLGSYQNGHPFKPEDRGEEGLPIIRISQLTSDDEPAYFDGELDGRVKVRTGDLLFSWSATIDSYIWNRGEAWLNQHIFKVTESQEAVKSFLYYIIKHIAPKLADFDAHGSTMRHIKKESLGEKLYIPPRQEQLAIASFLDRETAKIDALIAEQQRLIELLQEKRQAVISHAVTKGLNPNAPMKDSGVEWLGEVPEHWEVMNLAKAASLLQTGPFGSQLGTSDYVEEGIAVVNPSNICDESIDPGKGPFITPGKASELERHWLYEGDLVIARRGELGRCAVRENGSQPAICGTGSIMLRPKELTCPYYLANAIRSDYSRATLSLNSVGSTMENLSAAILGRLRVPMPPTKEQLEITEEIRAVGNRYQELIADALSAVELLTERRSALISAAVTGQIDVRGLAEAEEEA